KSNARTAARFTFSWEACLSRACPLSAGIIPGGTQKTRGAPKYINYVLTRTAPGDTFYLRSRRSLMDNAQKMVTLPEAARLAGVSEDELRCAIKDGLLQAQLLQNTGEYHVSG